MKRIAITGANGFIGRGLAARLLKQSECLPVRICRTCNEDLDSNSFAVGEINGDTDWGIALDGADAVVHLAARTHVLREQASDPAAAFHTINVDGTQRLFECAMAAGVTQFVYLSSIGVNGPETHAAPFTERDTPQPATPYARSKHDAEEVLRSLAPRSGMSVSIVRPPLVYGPRAPGNFQRLVRGVQSGMPLPFATLRNRRSFVSRDNLVDFIAACLMRPAPAHVAGGCETYLIADNESPSTPELIRAIAAGLDRPARLLPFPAPLLKAAMSAVGRSGMAQQLCGSLQIDTAKAKTELGWEPPQTFCEGIRAAVATV